MSVTHRPTVLKAAEASKSNPFANDIAALDSHQRRFMQARRAANSLGRLQQVESEQRTEVEAGDSSDESMQSLQAEDNNQDELSNANASIFKNLETNQVVTKEMLMNLNRLAVADTPRVESAANQVLAVPREKKQIRRRLQR